MFVKVVIAANVETGTRPLPGYLFRVVEDLASKRNMLGKFLLHLPPNEPVILDVWCMRNPVATTAITLPFPQFFLNPERKKKLGASSSKPFVVISRVCEKYRKDTNHRAILGVLDESVFDPQFSIAEACFS